MHTIISKNGAVRPAFSTLQRGGLSQPSPRNGRCGIRIKSTEKADQLILKGKERYLAKDLMNSLKLYEEAATEPDISKKQKLQAMYGMMSVHSSFGDVEVAQMMLRESIASGMDLEEMLVDPEMPTIITSVQIMIQLRKFNQTLRKSNATRASGSPKPQFTTVSSAPKGSSSGGRTELDLQSLLGTTDPDGEAIDASPMAVARRVALVILVGVLAGTVLFFGGLELTFPKFE